MSPIKLRGVDRAWLRMDTETSLMLIEGILFFDEGIDVDELRETLESRLSTIPRFHQVVVGDADGHHWVDVDSVDLEQHLSVLELKTEQDLMDLASRLLTQPLQTDIPLWHFTVARGLGEDGKGAALIGRLHHCIGDGLALMMVLLSLADPDDADGEETIKTKGNPLSRFFNEGVAVAAEARAYGERIMPQAMRLMSFASSAASGAVKGNKLGLVGKGIAGLGKLTFRSSDKKTPLSGPLGGSKRAAWSNQIPLETVKAVTNNFGEGTVTDVLITAICGGLRRYLIERDHPVEGLDIRAVVPVNLRSLEAMAELGNQFGLVFLPLPVGVADALERMKVLRQRMLALRNSPEPVLTYGLLDVFGRVPKFAQDAAVKIFGKKATAVLSSVPGPVIRLKIGSKPITRMMFWVPQAAHLGMGISILSYNGSVLLGLATDTALVPDPERILTHAEAELESMLEAR